MQQIIKHYFCIALLALGLQSSWGFALLGPLTLANGADGWQSPVIGYDLAYMTVLNVPGNSQFLGDIGGPRNLAEEYRRNVPYLYYSYDETFLNFFGTTGASAVDGAYSIMNALPSADKLDVSQYPLEAMHPNYTAQNYYLTDIKSRTLHLLVEQLGLADPERFVWTLHDRDVPPGCPLTTMYLVVQRNFDYQTSPLTQVQYSPYINDIFYTYFIVENCTGPSPLAWTVPFSTDPEATPYTTVAANSFDGNLMFFDEQNFPHTLSGGLQIGYFYSGLTRDDVAGLKYLYTTNNVNYELPDPTSLFYSVTTNMAATQPFPPLIGNSTNIFNGTNGGAGYYTTIGTTNSFLGYGDLTAFLAFSKTNDPATLQAAYPGVVIASWTNVWTIVSNATYITYYTNAPVGSPYGSPPTLVIKTNYTLVWQSVYTYKFANIFTNHNGPGMSKLITVSVGTPIGSPYGSPGATNMTVKNISRPSGDFFVLPLFHTNVCPIDILTQYGAITNVLAMTNLVSIASTNTTATNLTSYTYLVDYFTNYSYIIAPVTCSEVANAVNYYQGIGGTKFIRHDYDSLIGQYFLPVTNYYTMMALTNNHWIPQRFVRVITSPDIIMDAVDEDMFTVVRNINFTPSPRLNGLAGPGTIDTPSVFTYNKIGNAGWNGLELKLNQVLISVTNGFVYQKDEIPSLAWASFDGSTNEPVVYPNGTSIATLEAILAVSFSPSSPPDGYKNTSYSKTFTVSTGLLQTPLNWTAAGLPPGMSLTPAANGSDFILYGTPTVSGTYDFVLLVTDANGYNAQWNFTITIH